MVDSSDHVTGKTGLTLTITASKDGGAFASITPTVTELASGFYKIALTTSHTDTLGDLALHITATGADATDIVDQVVALDFNDAVSLSTIASYIDTEVAAALAAVDTEVGAIKAKTDNLPSDPADASDIAASHASLSTKLDTIDDFLDTEVVAIKTVTDKLDDTLEDDAGTYRFTENALEMAPAGEGGGGATAAQIADAVWDERVDDHLADRSFGSKIGIYLPVHTPDIDYKRIQRTIDEALKALPNPPTVDIEPVILALHDVFDAVRSIRIPEPTKPVDLAPVIDRIAGVRDALSKLTFPKTDLSSVESALANQKAALEPAIEQILALLEAIPRQVSESTKADVKPLQSAILELRTQFEEQPFIALQVPKKKERNVLDEYLSLDK